MKRHALDTAASSFDPATLKLLGHTFDAAWGEIAKDGGAATTDERRTRLALIVIEIAKAGVRDPGSIKSTAVKMMRALEHC
jgi:hypothetical protein